MLVRIVASPQEFHEWLQERLFRAVGLKPSARKIAESSGLSPNTVSAVLSGVKIPTEHSCQQLAPILRVTVDEMKVRAGLTPLLEFDAARPSPPGLSEDERQSVISALEATLEFVKSL